jgi:hypothetical protein
MVWTGGCLAREGQGCAAKTAFGLIRGGFLVLFCGRKKDKEKIFFLLFS